MFDKRQLGPHQFTFKKYVFNYGNGDDEGASIFMNYFRLNECTRLLFLFRRLITCRHRYSCIESIIRKFSRSVRNYLVLRMPVYYLLGALFFSSSTP